MLKFFKIARTNIVTGIVILIPSVTTIFLVFKMFSLIDSIPSNIFSTILPILPKDWVPGLGFIILVVIAYFVGVATKNYFGRMVIDSGNAIISKIPLLNKIYLGIQQVIDSVAVNKKKLFERAVLIEYPKKDSYCIGFVTSKTTGEIPAKTSCDMYSIFVPTTPNPTSGFLLFIPKIDVIELDMTVETAIKTVMSAGMVNTDHLKNTNHMYSIPKHMKNWNWLKLFKKNGNKSLKSDPRD